MTVALAGRAPATFEIKSAMLPLVALLLKSANLTRLAEEFAARYGDMPQFFDRDPLLVDLSPLQQAEPGAQVDFPALLSLLRPYSVLPIAVRGGSEEQMAAALDAGLVAAPDLVLAREKKSAEEPTLPPEPAAAPQLVAPAPTSALVIDRPLRSGQQVYARGRDLVVLAMVNPGAEVIADGHVHVYAPLRGRAIAGARGNTEARILSLCFEPELVSIAGVYRTSETPWPAALRGKPAQIRLDGGDAGRLTMEPLNP